MRAFVTGGSASLGSAVCRALARDGHSVAVGYFTGRDRGEAVAEEIRHDGVDAVALPIDVRDVTSVEECVQAAAAGWGGIEILVNAAGRTADGLVSNLDPSEALDVYWVNVLGTIRCVRAVLPWLLRNRWGRIVNFSSILATRCNSGTVGYSSTKGAIESTTRSLAVELGAKGITVNAVAPGFVHGGLGLKALQAAGESVRVLVPSRRDGTPEEVASVVAFLVSEAASYVNGAIIPVDGGLQAGSRLHDLLPALQAARGE